MAFKKYAYYNKGNKVALVESEMSSGGGNLAVAHCTLGGYTTKDTCEAAGGQWIPSSTGSNSGNWEKYITPKESIADGLEVEYSYVPTYNLNSDWEEGEDLHKFLGWGSNGENLVFFTYGASAVLDLSSKYAAGDFIYVKGSGRWSGIHEVKVANTWGGLVTTTRLNLPGIYSPLYFDVDETIIGGNTDANSEVEVFKSNISHRDPQYIFTKGAANASNTGFFKLSSDSTVGQLTVSKKYTIKNEDNSYLESAAALSNEDGVTVNIYPVVYEEIDILEDIEIMQDESFELDLTEYQAQSVVYYVKAKLAEDLGDFERREYFMRLFKKQIEKASGGRKRGPYIIQGFSGMRK
tara:strand:+ start:3398 stop:4450 length:1053 start_codon:yes stop_codon:yes gene_type:complete